jgi:hypothetical protein
MEMGTALSFVLEFKEIWRFSLKSKAAMNRRTPKELGK